MQGEILDSRDDDRQQLGQHPHCSIFDSAFKSTHRCAKTMFMNVAFTKNSVDVCRTAIKKAGPHPAASEHSYRACGTRILRTPLASTGSASL